MANKLNYVILIGLFVGISWFIRVAINYEVSCRVKDRYAKTEPDNP